MLDAYKGYNNSTYESKDKLISFRWSYLDYRIREFKSSFELTSISSANCYKYNKSFGCAALIASFVSTSISNSIFEMDLLESL